MTTVIDIDQARKEARGHALFAAQSAVFRAAQPKAYARIESALRDAVLDLSFDYPYFGIAAARVAGQFWIVPGIGTACVSTRGYVYWDPDFANSLSHGQKAWVWAHELSHLLYGHAFRRQGRQHRLWNIVGDLSINAILRDAFTGTWVKEPADILIPDRNRWDWHAEKHFDAMLQEQEPPPPPPPGGDEGDDGQEQDEDDDSDPGQDPNDADGDDADGDGGDGGNGGDSDSDDSDADGGNGNGTGQPGDGEPQDGGGSGQGSGPRDPGPHQPAPGQGCGPLDLDDDNTSGSREHEYKWREISVQSESLQKQCGKEQGAGLCKLSAVPDPKVKWRNVLRKGCALAKAAAGKDRKTWSKRGRRSQLYGSPVVWPGWVGTKARAAVVIDTSGSMSDRALHQCVSETLTIARESGVPIYLVTHDHGVQWEGWIRPTEKAASIEASLVGRGGTCAREAYARVDNPRAVNCRHGGTGCACARRPVKFDVMIHLTDCYLSWPEWPASVRRIIVARIETDKPDVPDGADVIDVDVEGTY